MQELEFQDLYRSRFLMQFHSLCGISTVQSLICKDINEITIKLLRKASTTSQFLEAATLPTAYVTC